ncbi:DUF1772 domain-containing protein [Subtercola lobariae]|uniref:Membrane protein n=1 Tax=Subtercola lobariae TaxID=1588641 RepID=A0A917BBU6_9MICO|nr:DUF1772 domain-containing protein [Subtercola lobariae]GGF32926.1 membrane protein [Subtercola lobariae]
MESVLAIVTTTVVGLMVGVEFAVALIMNPIILAMPGEAALSEPRAKGSRTMGRVMPFWYLGSLILTVALAVTTWGTPASSAALAAAVLLVVSVILSVTLLVPINNRSTMWTPDDHPADWREQLRRWDRLHYARVALIVAAFILVATAVALL